MSGMQENAAGIVEAMELRLGALEPDLVEIYDESAEHVGHAGAQSGGGHYQLTIVARRFEGQPRVARHRLVYDALGEMMHKEVHALAITALTPEELREAWPTDEPRAGR
jgi:BolA family transcriptional regulator, general stress-responsive regulator